MKKIIYIVVVLLVIGAMIFGGIYLNQKSIDDSYNNAITLIQNGTYEGALDELEKANPDVIDRDDFEWDLKRDNLGECYKNTVPLYAYAMAQMEYNLENGYMHTVNDCLELIPEDYNGELSDEIKTFKGNFKPQYDEFLKEQERLAEEARIATEKAYQEMYASLKKKIPYEGMPEAYINDTIMGKYHEKDTSSKYGFTKYYWRTNYGDIMLIVSCYEGEVSSVSRYGWGYFWTDDIKPIWNGKNPYTSSSYKSESKSKKSDPYNVNDYSDPEDFYYDNYDDFWEYEEAEDYFNEHHD